MATSAAAEAATVQSFRTQSSGQYAITALVLYEHLLTTPEEIEHVWNRKKTIVFALFICLRYTNLLVQVIDCVTNAAVFKSVMGCTSAYVVQSTVIFIRDTCLSSVLVLRCYAVWNRNVAVLLLLCSVYAAQVAVNGVISFYLPKVKFIPLVSNCVLRYARILDKFYQAFFSLTLALDSVALLLTVAKTFKLSRDAKRARLKRGLSYFILRDAILYFISVDTLALVAIIAMLVAPGDLTSILQAIYRAVGSIMVQRLILNLRQVSDAQRGPFLLTRQLGKLDFAYGSIIGNIGAPLNIEDDDAAVSTATVDSGVSLDQMDGQYEVGADRA